MSSSQFAKGAYWISEFDRLSFSFCSWRSHSAISPYKYRGGRV